MMSGAFATVVCGLWNSLPIHVQSLHHSQHFVKSWKLIYFDNLTRTLLYNCGII